MPIGIIAGAVGAVAVGVFIIGVTVIVRRARARVSDVKYKVKDVKDAVIHPSYVMNSDTLSVVMFTVHYAPLGSQHIGRLCVRCVSFTDIDVQCCVRTDQL